MTDALTSARAAGIDRPAAIVELMILDVSRHPHADRVRFQTQKRQQQDVFRLENRVAFQLGDPVAFLVLPREEPVGRPFERRFQGILREIGMTHR